MARECYGGPLDGLQAQSSHGTFKFIDELGKCYPTQAKGRHLYQRDRNRWRYGGPGARRCDNCGAILSPKDGNPVPRVCWCGETAAPA